MQRLGVDLSVGSQRVEERGVSFFLLYAVCNMCVCVTYVCATTYRRVCFS